MVPLEKKQVQQLLKLIRNREDRRTVKLFLQDLGKTGKGTDRPNSGKLKHKAANVLNILWRVGTEIGKHEVINKFLEMFD
jgi:hypothetical protein